VILCFPALVVLPFEKPNTGFFGAEYAPQNDKHSNSLVWANRDSKAFRVFDLCATAFQITRELFSPV
jgi:hypothetical protein